MEASSSKLSSIKRTRNEHGDTITHSETQESTNGVKHGSATHVKPRSSGVIDLTNDAPGTVSEKRGIPATRMPVQHNVKPTLNADASIQSIKIEEEEANPNVLTQTCSRGGRRSSVATVKRERSEIIDIDRYQPGTLADCQSRLHQIEDLEEIRLQLRQAAAEKREAELQLKLHRLRKG